MTRRTCSIYGGNAHNTSIAGAAPRHYWEKLGDHCHDVSTRAAYPPEAAGIAGGKLWRSQDCPQTEKRDEEPQGLHGDDRAAWAAVLDQCKQEAAEIGATFNEEELTARQLALWIHGNYQDFPVWPHTHSQAEVGSNITVYTDGGVEMGTSFWMGMGTWGVYG